MTLWVVCFIALASIQGVLADAVQCGQTISGSTAGRASTLGNRASDMTYTFTAEQSQYVFDLCAADYDSLLRVYDRNGDEVASNDDHGGACSSGSGRFSSHLSIALIPGQDYTLLVEGYRADSGAFTLVVSCSGPGPSDGANDDSLQCGSTVSGSTRGLASRVGYASGEATFEFTTSEEGVVTFDLCDSEYDSYLRILDTSGTELAANNDHGSRCSNPRHPYASHLAVSLTADRTYTIVVEGFKRAEGNYALAVTCGGNQGNTIACGQTVSGSTVGLSSSLGHRSGEASYEFVATQREYVFDACQSRYDSLLRVYDASGNQIGMNDDHRGRCASGSRRTASHLTVSTVIGQAYTLVIEGYGNSEGNFAVTAACSSTGGDGGGAVVDCVGSWSQFGSCSATCGGGVRSRTYSITTNAANGGSQCPTFNGATETQTCNNNACPANQYAPPRGCTCTPVNHPSWGRIDSCTSPAGTNFQPFCYVTGSCAMQPSSSVPGRFWADCVRANGGGSGGGSGSSGTVNSEAWRAFQLLNEWRSRGWTCQVDGTVYGPSHPYIFDCRLWRASRLHSEDMRDNNHWGHDSSDGRSPWDRAAEQDVTASGENIARSPPDAEILLGNWRNSGHCHGLYNPEAVIIGIGWADAHPRPSDFWTMMIGLEISSVTGQNQLDSVDTSCYPVSG